jgi:hypothetical protein
VKASSVLVVTLVVLVLLQPALLLLAAHYGVISSFNSEAELASIMGAIFTAGGLIVALVSLYTLWNVNQVVENAVDASMAAVPRQVDERIRTFLDAYSSFREAQDMWARYQFAGLTEIEELILRAEAIEPTLVDLRVWSGLLFFQAARGSYLREYVGDGTYSGCPDKAVRPALAMKALQRLEADFAGAPGGSAAAALRIAQMHALLGDLPAVSRWVKRSHDIGGSTSLEGVAALTLMAACRSTQDARRVLNAYGATAMSASDISTAAKNGASGIRHFVVVIDSPEALQNRPTNPAVVTLRTVDNWNSAFMEWRAVAQRIVGTLHGGMPSFGKWDEQMGGQDNPPFESLDALLAKASEQFMFVCPYNYEPFLVLP